jgi:hypothetical protein
MHPILDNDKVKKNSIPIFVAASRAMELALDRPAP